MTSVVQPTSYYDSRKHIRIVVETSEGEYELIISRNELTNPATRVHNWFRLLDSLERHLFNDRMKIKHPNAKKQKKAED